MAAKAKDKKYIVSDKGYLLKEGKIYQEGEEIVLSPEEYKNVKDKVVEADAKDAPQTNENTPDEDAPEEDKKK
ncbi:hypothetical protein A9485_02280 [Bacillus cereus]|uniref:hypothetical protein n=1 Tax=Bacillus cereus group TaxID=86661 RepID=UPI0008FE44CF|nr:hypothetical protein [Bacillus cereus]OJD89924.1 hypothetical protein A9485_02280 [Bacillus cereus]HDR8409170.1 hypothetical protein [Bacillus cereus]